MSVKNAVIGDVLGFAAVLFLANTYLAFWALRGSKEARLVVVTRAIDFLFIAGLTLVVVAGVGMVYAIF